ncbi:hypothetical protein [Enterobacter hormaechei]|uniref:hypothetical protein n=1 Tax=Enterobacter hormaechei TaxID=158836 RepID=UPI000735D0B1|nr:hypothetical protein [Enterobacter hormaechei]KTI31873.1 hypothetical protein ASV06_20985 [Enterobacter hormaechei subsp. xiangfangensis]HCR5077181.1 hypothetical protein [Enterobacter hormaechei subsp. xiangfangensis]
MLANNTILKITAAIELLREHQQEARQQTNPQVFNPAPNNVLGVRAHAIEDLYTRLSSDALTSYLHGLGYVRAQIMTSRDVLNVEGKKKYEAYIGKAVENIPVTFGSLKRNHLNTLTDLINIPFRRSAEKDRREISERLCIVTSFIEGYRYQGIDERYREYTHTIIAGIDTEQLPPMIAGLIVREISELVDAACRADVLTFVNSGITHHEFWRHTAPDEYAEVFPDNELPSDSWALENTGIYSVHEGIARQSLWYGHDVYVDDFIVSLAGGLLHRKYPLKYPS